MWEWFQIKPFMQIDLVNEYTTFMGKKRNCKSTGLLFLKTREKITNKLEKNHWLLNNQSCFLGEGFFDTFLEWEEDFSGFLTCWPKMLLIGFTKCSHLPLWSLSQRFPQDFFSIAHIKGQSTLWLHTRDSIVYIALEI